MHPLLLRILLFVIMGVMGLDTKEKFTVRDIAKCLSRHSQSLMSLSGGMPIGDEIEDPARGESTDYKEESKTSSIPDMMIAFMRKGKKK